MDSCKTPLKSIEVKRILKPFEGGEGIIPYLIFALDFLLYVSLFWGIIIVEYYLVKLLLALILGVVIGALFVVGHDCAHFSFTKGKSSNKILGIICFLPSLHNISLWDYFHNKIHHCFTNLKSKDFVYTPLSPEEYLQLSEYKKFLYRVTRTSIGHALYYVFDIWPNKMFFPTKQLPEHKRSVKRWLYSLPLVIFLLTAISINAYLSYINNQDIVLNCTFTIVIPFLVYNWLMGFAIYQHHTNPLVKWYEDKNEWHYWEVQMAESTHVELPRPINTIFHNIMEHTAHHSNANIPLYKLVKAQKALENEFGDRIKMVDWDMAFYINSLKTCKLYDYKNHQWLTFADIK